MKPNETLTDLLKQLLDRLRIRITIELDPETKQPPQPTDDISHNQSTSFKLLDDYGIEGDDVLTDLASRFTPARIKQCTQAIDNNNGAVRSKPAYLRKALECGYYKSNPYRQRRKQR